MKESKGFLKEDICVTGIFLYHGSMTSRCLQPVLFCLRYAVINLTMFNPLQTQVCVDVFLSPPRDYIGSWLTTIEAPPCLWGCCTSSLAPATPSLNHHLHLQCRRSFAEIIQRQTPHLSVGFCCHPGIDSEYRTLSFPHYDSDSLTHNHRHSSLDFLQFLPRQTKSISDSSWVCTKLVTSARTQVWISDLSELLLFTWSNQVS